MNKTTTPNGHGMGWNKPDELNNQLLDMATRYAADSSRQESTIVLPFGELVAFIDAHTAKAVAEVETRHQEIYAWLLGLRGDFPASEPGARYNWRSYLRKKIPGDMLLRINKQSKSAPSPAQENE
jgi:hypothetical protein